MAYGAGQPLPVLKVKNSRSETTRSSVSEGGSASLKKK